MISLVTTAPKADEYLEKHQLIPQFKKAVQKLKSGHQTGSDFKKREQKSANIWPLRINQKY